MTDQHTDRDTYSPKGGCSSNDTCHCSIDPRERHVVCKLDRYELEDRYLRVLGDLHTLKKLSNEQEDKIKRLATKLMRFGATPRPCIPGASVYTDQERLSLLEDENSKLRSKICILRNQLVNNKFFARSSARRRFGSTSGLLESARSKAPSCQCASERTGNEDNDVQNYLLKIQEMEMERKRMISHIADLKAELASFSSGSRREKAAENVEYIRVWRQMQRQNEKLVNAQGANEILNEQFIQLKSRFEECKKNNLETSAALEAERMQVAQLEEKMSKFKDFDVDVREKDERLMDLMNEMEILQQHNRELLKLSSKFGNLEKVNTEYKRKVSEQAAEIQNLKDNLSKEKTNMGAIQASNEQLLLKVNDLQRNIDLMTIKLVEKKERRSNIASKKTGKKKLSSVSFPEEQRILSDDNSSIDSETYTKYPNEEKGKNSNNATTKNSNDVKAKNLSNTKIRNSINSNEAKTRDSKESYKSEKSSQALVTSHLMNETTQTEKPSDSAKPREKASVDFEPTDKTNIQPPRNFIPLSRERMLQLLDEVQTRKLPSESNNSNNTKPSVTSSLIETPARPVTKIETMLFGDAKV